MTERPALHLFQAYGIELEYMIIDRETLKVRPIADLLLQEMAGEPTGDFENGSVTWSNELVKHVVELKCTDPTADLIQLEKDFQANVQLANKCLEKWNACLLPSAAHPFMDPLKDTVLWDLDYNDVYSRYNEIFDCKGHGWSNLQSTHINFPFSGDEEFRKLHAACRLVLPLVPLLAASSPILDKAPTGLTDTRLQFYRDNQKKFPVISNGIIPDSHLGLADYTEKVYTPIAAVLAPYNSDDLLDPVWVNSRGAMARFDRGSIEIRVMDIQECPAMDMTISTFLISLVRYLVEEVSCDFVDQYAFKTSELKDFLNETMSFGKHSKMNTAYARLFGINDNDLDIEGFLTKVLTELHGTYPFNNEDLIRLQYLLRFGNLSERIMESYNNGISIDQIYRNLADCLDRNHPYSA